MSELMIPGPLPWELYSPALFRLPGHGGAALFLRTTIVPGIAGQAMPTVAFDVGLLSPSSLTRYLGRPGSPRLPELLSAFFLAVASSDEPAHTIPAVSDPLLGFEIAATASDALSATLLVTLTESPDAPIGEPDGLDFQTSRAVLAQAALDVRYLDLLEADRGGLAEPPEDWGI